MFFNFWTSLTFPQAVARLPDQNKAATDECIGVVLFIDGFFEIVD